MERAQLTSLSTVAGVAEHGTPRHSQRPAQAPGEATFEKGAVPCDVMHAAACAHNTQLTESTSVSRETDVMVRSPRGIGVPGCSLWITHGGVGQPILAQRPRGTEPGSSALVVLHSTLHSSGEGNILEICMQ